MLASNSHATSHAEQPPAAARAGIDASLRRFQSTLSRICEKYDRPFLDCETEVVDLSTLTILKGSSKRGPRKAGIIAGIKEGRELGEEITIDDQTLRHSETYQAESGGSDSSDLDLTDLEREDEGEGEDKARAKGQDYGDDGHSHSNSDKSSVSAALLSRMQSVKKILLKCKSQPCDVFAVAAQQPGESHLSPKADQAISLVGAKRPRETHKTEPRRPRGRPRKIPDTAHAPPQQVQRRKRRRRRGKEEIIQAQAKAEARALRRKIARQKMAFQQLNDSMAAGQAEPSFSSPAHMLSNSLPTPEPSSCSSEHASAGLPPVLLEIAKEDPALLSLYHAVLASPHYRELSSLCK